MNDLQTGRTKDTHQKALEINRDLSRYGSFAEIGAGQEVVRWFFRTGGAAQTISKSMSTYDMTVSDAVYGACDRYVCRDRLESMLDHEHTLNLSRLGTVRGDATAFFAFADTVAARSKRVTAYWHGWMGIRFQAHPRQGDSQITLHVRMKDRHNALQQEALGIVGVNLIYGACFLHDRPVQLIESLLDGLSNERIEIDMIEFSGDIFQHIDNRVMSLHLVTLGVSDAAMFAPNGEVLQPTEQMYRKNILVERGAFRPVTDIHMDMLRAAREKLGVPDEEVVEIAEISMTNLMENGCWMLEDFIARADLLGAVGKNVLISNYPEHYRLADYLSSCTDKPVGIAMGAPSLRELFDEKYYNHLEGGILESLGRLFKKRVRLYVYPYLDPATGTLIGVRNPTIPKQLTPLYQYLIDQNHLIDLDNCNDVTVSASSSEILSYISSGDDSWEAYVPKNAARLIKERSFFGFEALE